MNKVVIKEVTARAARGARELATVALAIVPGPRGQQFEITSSTGYRAVLPMCTCEGTPCVKKSCTGRGHCHGFFGKHEEHALVLLDGVVKTYGSGLGAKANPSQGRTHLHRLYGYNGRVREVSVREWEQHAWFEQVVR